MDAQAWTDTLRESFNFPGADASLIDNPLARAMREIAGQGAKGFEQMITVAKPLAFSADEVAANRKNWIREWLQAVTQ